MFTTCEAIICGQVSHQQDSVPTGSAKQDSEGIKSASDHFSLGIGGTQPTAGPAAVTEIG